MMLSKRKMCKWIKVYGGCANAPGINGCNECPLDNVVCKDDNRSILEMAKEWLETHPKKEKEPWVPKIGDIVIYFWANNHKHGKISYIDRIDNDREYPYHLACDYNAKHIGLVKKLREIKEPEQYFKDKGRYIYD